MTTPSRCRLVRRTRYFLPLAACLLCAACQDRRDPVKPTVAQPAPITLAVANALAAH